MEGYEKFRKYLIEPQGGVCLAAHDRAGVARCAAFDSIKRNALTNEVVS